MSQIALPKKFALGSNNIQSFPKTQYDKIKEIIDALNAITDGVYTMTDLTLTGDLIVGDDATITGDLAVTATLDVTGAVTFNATTASTTKDTGAVVLQGGMGVEKEIYAGLSIN